MQEKIAKSALIKTRKQVLDFRDKWETRIAERAEQCRGFKANRGDVRRLFFVFEEAELLDAFEKEMDRIEAMIQRLYAGTDLRRCSTLWTPTLIRRCTRLRLVSSPAVSQRRLSGRDLYRIPRQALPVDDDVQVVERRTSGKRYALQFRARDVDSESEFSGEMPFTKWAVAERLTDRARMRGDAPDIPAQPRESSEDDSDSWAATRRARLIHASGPSNFYTVEHSEQDNAVVEGDWLI
jgi:hypothetical protein